MLVLLRTTGQQISIGDDITITVVRFHPHKSEVLLGIEAPKAVTVYPTELTGADLAIWKEAANDCQSHTNFKTLEILL